MHGNTPYGGSPGSVPAGHAGPGEGTDLSPADKQRIRRELSQVAALIRLHLPDEYVIGTDLTYGVNGLEAMVAVQPPIGEPVSAGFSPTVPEEGDTETYIDESTRKEIARGLAASAVFQVRHAVPSEIVPPAR